MILVAIRIDQVQANHNSPAPALAVLILEHFKEKGGKTLKLGTIMQACRERAGLSQEELAEKLHRSRSCISKFENDKKTYDFQTVLAWINATGCQEVAVAFFVGMDGLSIMQNLLSVASVLMRHIRMQRS